jgi:hypothetical protein
MMTEETPPGAPIGEADGASDPRSENIEATESLVVAIVGYLRNVHLGRGGGKRHPSRSAESPSGATSGRNILGLQAPDRVPRDLDVVLVAPLLWAVYDSDVRTDAAVGHIESLDGRFYVGVQGEDYLGHSFATYDGAVQWFTGHCAAVIKSSASSSGFGEIAAFATASRRR